MKILLLAAASFAFSVPATAQPAQGHAGHGQHIPAQHQGAHANHAQHQGHAQHQNHAQHDGHGHGQHQPTGARPNCCGDADGNGRMDCCDGAQAAQRPCCEGHAHGGSGQQQQDRPAQPSPR